MPRDPSLHRSSGLVVFGVALGAITGAATLVLLARAMTPAAFVSLAALTPVVGVISVLGRFGFDRLAVRHYWLSSPERAAAYGASISPGWSAGHRHARSARAGDQSRVQRRDAGMVAHQHGIRTARARLVHRRDGSLRHGRPAAFVGSRCRGHLHRQRRPQPALVARRDRGGLRVPRRDTHDRDRDRGNPFCLVRWSRRPCRASRVCRSRRKLGCRTTAATLSIAGYSVGFRGCGAPDREHPRRASST